MGRYKRGIMNLPLIEKHFLDLSPRLPALDLCISASACQGLAWPGLNFAVSLSAVRW